MFQIIDFIGFAMGLRQKFIAFVFLIAAVLGVSSYLFILDSHNEIIESEAVRIAEIVSAQVLADREIYTGVVIKKLETDGSHKGGVRDYKFREGFIPLPAQFVRSVSKKVKEKSKDLYSYQLISKWNLNRNQGLKDQFDEWAWGELEKQDEKLAEKNSGESGYLWDPVYRFEMVNNKRTLRYMRADSASTMGCVTCHNDYENQEDVIAMRIDQGIKPRKQWQLHSLVGGIKVEIPLDLVSEKASLGRNMMLFKLGGILILSFLVLYFLIVKHVFKPILEVENAARRMAKGDYKSDLVVHSDDEIGRMASSFKQMASAVQERDKQIGEYAIYLEQRVKYRTKELESTHKKLVVTSRKAGNVRCSVWCHS